MESQNSVPFEDTSQPFFSRLFRTIIMAFSEPMKLFSGMPRGDIGLPLLYGVITGTITGIISIFWHMSFSGMALLTRHMPVEEFALSTGLYFLFMFLCPIGTFGSKPGGHYYYPVAITNQYIARPH